MCYNGTTNGTDSETTGACSEHLAGTRALLLGLTSMVSLTSISLLASIPTLASISALASVSTLISIAAVRRRRHPTLSSVIAVALATSGVGSGGIMASCVGCLGRRDAGRRSVGTL